MRNSIIYGNEEANNYFLRNKEHGISFFIDYLIHILSKNDLREMDLCEFGIGNGANLLYLAEHARTCHGYEISGDAVSAFRDTMHTHHNVAKLDVEQVNLAGQFTPKQKYDLVLFGFFPYYCDDSDMNIVLENTLKCLKPNGLVYVFDFLVRENRIKPDSRNKDLKVYKRSLHWWVTYFTMFDIMDYRLFDSSKTHVYRWENDGNCCDLHVDNSDDNWIFSSLFRLK